MDIFGVVAHTGDGASPSDIPVLADYLIDDVDAISSATPASHDPPYYYGISYANIKDHLQSIFTTPSSLSTIITSIDKHIFAIQTNVYA